MTIFIRLEIILIIFGFIFLSPWIIIIRSFPIFRKKEDLYVHVKNDLTASDFWQIFDSIFCLQSVEQSSTKTAYSKKVQAVLIVWIILLELSELERVLSIKPSRSDISVNNHATMLFVLSHPLSFYIYARTRVFLGAFFPLLRYFHPISQACHFLAKLVSVCGQKGARSDVCVRFHNGTPTSMASRLAALCMQTENVSSPSMTGHGRGR